jgi:hypothetical protein
LFYKKFSRIKEKIRINENLPSYSYIIKNEEHYEKAVLAEATRFNLLLEAKMERAELEQKHREIKEQISFFQHGITYFEQTSIQKVKRRFTRRHEFMLNAGVILGFAIGIT